MKVEYMGIVTQNRIHNMHKSQIVSVVDFPHPHVFAGRQEVLIAGEFPLGKRFTITLEDIEVVGDQSDES